MSSRTRQQNVSAAQWSANGGALGAPDLTEAGASIYGENVFSAAVQKTRLHKDVYKQLQATLEKGSALDPKLPTPSPRRCASGRWRRARRTTRTGSSR